NPAEEWDAVVIGSGIGGLTAAVLLARHAGRRVLVLERHYEAGGFTHTFRRPGFRWDVGLHYIGQVGEERSAVRRAFDSVTGGAVAWQPMPEVYDRVFIGGRRFDFPSGAEALRASLLEAFPSEARAIDRYLQAVRAANRWSGLYFAEKAVPAALGSLLGGAMRAPYLHWARRTTRDVLAGITGNPELRGVLAAQWGDYGLPPAQSSFAVHAMIAEHYLNGGFYPVGGAGAIAAAMAPEIERAGGKVVTSAEAAGIVVEGGRAAGVRMSDGRVFRAPLIVSDAGAANTVERLLPPDLPELDALRGELRRLTPSTAHASLYLGLSETDTALGLTGTNLWVYPSFDHDANVERFSRDLSAPLPVVYMSFPSAKDPDFQRQYPGHSTVEAITMLPWQPFAGWAETRWKRRGAEYEQLKAELAARLRAEVERHVPRVASHIEHAELSTPVTTRHFMNYSQGEIYGIAATPQRFLTRRLGARTPVRGLYLTGQDAAGLGVVGALFGGVLSASAALGKNLVSIVTK
ncbi:MAG TPA: NAD(P)/FAD-dependent oxidoreductase, partial [Acidobacteriaceae bacterium]|nr:NAD(P)/FAD-dependent oxidoreductase [Acidobacteriaceae bacterium]